MTECDNCQQEQPDTIMIGTRCAICLGLYQYDVTNWAEFCELARLFQDAEPEEQS